MNGRFLVFLALVSSLPVSFPGAGAADDPDAPAPPLLAATDDTGLRAAVGKAVIVRGKVSRTGKAKATGVNFLNFEKGEFTVVTFGKNLKAFADGEPADLYKDQWVEIRGEVTLYKDKPQIELASPDQITIIKEKLALEATVKKAEASGKAPAEGAKVAEDDATVPKARDVDPRKYFTD